MKLPSGQLSLPDILLCWRWLGRRTTLSCWSLEPDVLAWRLKNRKTDGADFTTQTSHKKPTVTPTIELQNTILTKITLLN